MEICSKTKKRACLLTVAKEEFEFTPIFLNYYMPKFLPSDIFYLNNDGTQEIKTLVRGYSKEINVIDIFNKTGKSVHDFLRETVQNKISSLLDGYEHVVFCEIDEIIIPNPDIYSSFSLIFQNKNIRCTGYDLVQTDSDPPYKWGAILKNRSRWSRRKNLDKTLILSNPVRYANGFYECLPSTAPNQDIYLCHLHYFDKNIMLNKLHRSRRWDWGKENSSAGRQNKCDDEMALKLASKFVKNSKPFPSNIKKMI